MKNKIKNISTVIGFAFLGVFLSNAIDNILPFYIFPIIAGIVINL